MKSKFLQRSLTNLKLYLISEFLFSGRKLPEANSKYGSYQVTLWT